jgi:hypothetical protein
VLRLSMRQTGLAAAIVAALSVALFAPAASAAGSQKVTYRGLAIHVPATWPVYRLAAEPHRCVRFDRHAVYLGRPGAEQRCPADAIGRTEAVLVEPAPRRAAAPRALLRSASREAQLAEPAAGVRVTATWRNDPAALSGIVTAARKVARLRPLQPKPALPAPQLRDRASASSGTYTGLGFDACSAPSTTTITAWGASPFRALGVYIGGVNRACSQTNLTATWVASVIGAGWALIPTYVGPQAPGNTCGCAAVKPSLAAAQGAAAADDAVTQAAALGIGAGSPIYYDMEGYTRSSSSTAAVLAFLEAWTSQLHAHGYVSGVYGSALSTISDLTLQYGSGYQEPENVWIARWNDQQSTEDSSVPATYWADHQRIHQYHGGHNERYGGATINIDNDYIDASVVGTASAPVLPVKRVCPGVVFSHRTHAAARKVRTVNLFSCARAQRVIRGSKPRRFAAPGGSRFYIRHAFKCHGHTVGRARVLYSCAKGRAQVSFARNGVS